MGGWWRARRGSNIGEGVGNEESFQLLNLKEKEFT